MSISEKPLRFLRPKEPKPNSPLFVFLPGMDGTGQLLGTQLSRLEAAFDLRCLSIPSNDLTGWSGLVEQAANLIQAEQQLATTRPVYLCGESFGGCLALKLAAHSPELFDRMILVNPASSFSRQPGMRWGATVAQWLPDPLYQLSTVGLLPFLIAPERVDPQTQMALLTAMQSVTPETAAWRLSLLSHFSLDELPLNQIPGPVLVIASSADRLLPSGTEADRLVSYLPNAQKTVLPKSGHACLLETEVKLDEILRAHHFLDGQTSSRSHALISRS
ncbi:MAG: alpha/beta fold hydrolase [Xenococcaceae cyanobacterium]